MTSLLAAAHHISAPHIDWAGLSPIMALTAGGLVVLLVGLFRGAVMREKVVPALTVITLVVAVGLEIWRFSHHLSGTRGSIISGALEVDDLALELDMLFAFAGLAAVLLSWRSLAPRESGQGEYHSLLLLSVLGMTVLVSAQNLITLFLGIELLSIPLYVLCASEVRREGSLESGLKYLVIGSVGSATLVYGLALVYGASGSTDFSAIAAAVSQGKLAGGILGNPMFLTGLALVTVGFGFKASVAPFHQWTPDVYEGAPTPITAFMATATKAAALGVFLRFFDVAAIGAQNTWAPAVAAIAAFTMLVGNVGALGQSSLKRMLGYSGVAQAGYMLAGVVVGTQLGIQATVLYLIAYLAMNMAAFAVIVGEERGAFGALGEAPFSARFGEQAVARGEQQGGPGAAGEGGGVSAGEGGGQPLAPPSHPVHGDDISVLAGLGARRPWVAWPMTIAMLSLAGIPGTVGFVGKFQLIHALVNGDYTWLAIVLVVGSMISLGYYLRVVAAMWMRPPTPVAGRVRATAVSAPGGGAFAPMAGGSPEADAEGAGGRGSPGGAGGGGGGGGGSSSSGAGAGRSLDSPLNRLLGVNPPPGPAAQQPVPHKPSTQPEVVFVAVVSAAATLVLGIVPSPLFDFAAHAGHSIAGLF